MFVFDVSLEPGPILWRAPGPLFLGFETNLHLLFHFGENLDEVRELVVLSDFCDIIPISLR